MMKISSTVPSVGRKVWPRRLIAAGVPVELHLYPGAIHAFNAMPEAGLTKVYSRDLQGAIARLL